MLNNVIEAISSYQNLFKVEVAPSFQVSGVYDLFPECALLSDVKVEARWPQHYPSRQSGGVYVQFSEQMAVARIGHASSARTIEERLNDYFGYVAFRKGDKRCKLHQTDWPVRPRFLIVAAKEIKTTEWHIIALEEFLIETFRPPNNCGGKRDPR